VRYNNISVSISSSESGSELTAISSAIAHFARLQQTTSHCALTLCHAVFPVLRLPALLCPTLRLSVRPALFSSGRFTHCMPRPCLANAVPRKVYYVSFPFDLRSAAMSDSHLPRRVPAMSFFSRPRHSAAVDRRPVGDLPAIGFFRLPRIIPRKLPEAYQPV
jgi:hypothetical protein